MLSAGHHQSARRSLTLLVAFSRKIVGGGGRVTFPPFSCKPDIDEPAAVVGSIKIVIVLHITDAQAHGPANQVIGRIGPKTPRCDPAWKIDPNAMGRGRPQPASSDLRA